MTEFVTIHKSPYISEQREISRDNPVVFYLKGYPFTAVQCFNKKEFDLYNNDMRWRIAEAVYGK